VLSRLAGLLLPERYVLDRTALKQRAQTYFPPFARTETLRIDLPDRPDDTPDPLRRVAGDRSTCAPFVSTFREASLFGPAPLIVTSDGRIVLESAENSRSLLAARIRECVPGQLLPLLSTLLASTDRSSSARRLGAVFPLVRHPTTNYYHWLLGYLPKLRLYEWYADAVEPSTDLLIADDRPSWETESLELAGVDVSAATEWSGGSAVADRVAVPFHRDEYTPEFRPSGADYRWIRDRLRSNADLEADWPSRVYVSRDDATTRRVLNESDVVARLADMGFRKFELTSLSVPEQVALFASAEIVVGPHGAGLTNLVFADDAGVVEIQPREDVRPHYYLLAETLGFDYEYVRSPVRNDRTDMSVDVNALETAVHRLVSSRDPGSR